MLERFRNYLKDHTIIRILVATILTITLPVWIVPAIGLIFVSVIYIEIYDAIMGYW